MLFGICTVLKCNQKCVQYVVYLHSALINKRETRFGTFRYIFIFLSKKGRSALCNFAKWFILSKERKFELRKILNCNSEAPNASLIPSRFMIFFVAWWAPDRLCLTKGDGWWCICLKDYCHFPSFSSLLLMSNWLEPNLKRRQTYGMTRYNVLKRDLRSLIPIF